MSLHTCVVCICCWFICSWGLKMREECSSCRAPDSPWHSCVFRTFVIQENHSFISLISSILFLRFQRLSLLKHKFSLQSSHSLAIVLLNSPPLNGCSQTNDAWGTRVHEGNNSKVRIIDLEDVKSQNTCSLIHFRLDLTLKSWDNFMPVSSVGKQAHFICLLSFEKSLLLNRRVSVWREREVVKWGGP